MTHHVPKAHTAAQMRTMSNVGHWIEGTIISGAGALLLYGAVKPDDRNDQLATSLLTGAGSLLGLGLIGGSLEHGGPVTFFKADHQQRQHLEMAALLTAGGLSRRAGRIGRTLAAAATSRIGQMFLTHEQHGTSEGAELARGKHQRLGKTILAAAALSAVGELLDVRPVKAGGAVLLLASGAQLIAYREPEGAYEEAEAGNHR
jgi:hypothetical protein